MPTYLERRYIFRGAYEEYLWTYFLRLRREWKCVIKMFFFFFHLKYPHISLSMKRFLFNCRKYLSRTLSLIMAPTTIRPHFFQFTSKQILMERSFCRPVPIYRSSIPGYFRFAGNVVLYFSHHFINTEGRTFLSRERYLGHEILNVHPLYDC